MKRDEAWLAEYQARRASRFSTGIHSTAPLKDGDVVTIEGVPGKHVIGVPKYRNVKTNGCSSKREAKRAAELQLLERAGSISSLREQPKYLLVPKQEGERALHYIADFEYVRDGKTITEDVKGFTTDVYRIKRKLMLFVHGIRVQEVK